MRKLIYILMLLPFAVKAQIPNINNTQRPANPGAAYTPRVSDATIGADFIRYMQRGTSITYDAIYPGAYIVKYFSLKSAIQAKIDSLSALKANLNGGNNIAGVQNVNGAINATGGDISANNGFAIQWRNTANTDYVSANNIGAGAIRYIHNNNAGLGYITTQAGNVYGNDPTGPQHRFLRDNEDNDLGIYGINANGFRAKAVSGIGTAYLFRTGAANTNDDWAIIELAANKKLRITKPQAGGGFIDTAALEIDNNTRIVDFKNSPTMPTPSANDNSIKGATTAYVDASVLTAARGRVSLSGNVTAILNYDYINTTATQYTLTPPVTTGFTTDGSKIITGLATGSGGIRVFCPTGYTIQTPAGFITPGLGYGTIIQNQKFQLIPIGTNAYYLQPLNGSITVS